MTALFWLLFHTYSQLTDALCKSDWIEKHTQFNQLIINKHHISVCWYNDITTTDNGWWSVGNRSFVRVHDDLSLMCHCVAGDSIFYFQQLGHTFERLVLSAIVTLSPVSVCCETVCGSTAVWSRSREGKWNLINCSVSTCCSTRYTAATLPETERQSGLAE